MLNKAAFIALVGIGLLMAAMNTAPPPTEAKAAPINPPPGNVAAMQAEINRLAAELADVKQELANRPGQDAPLPPNVAPDAPTQPVAASVKADCPSGQCRVVYAAKPKQYVPQRRRAILPWRR